MIAAVMLSYEMRGRELVKEERTPFAKNIPSHHRYDEWCFADNPTYTHVECDPARGARLGRAR